MKTYFEAKALVRKIRKKVNRDALESVFGVPIRKLYRIPMIKRDISYSKINMFMIIFTPEYFFYGENKIITLDEVYEITGRKLDSHSLSTIFSVNQSAINKALEKKINPSRREALIIESILMK